MPMKITCQFFAAYLKCPTKCWLRCNGDKPTGNAYAEWLATQNDSYREQGAKRLMADVSADECTTAPVVKRFKTAKWRLAIDIPVQTVDLETRLHAVERVSPVGRGHAAQFIPIRFVFLNKLDRHDRLLLAFDAVALAESLGTDIPTGMIIHGDDHSTLKVKTHAMAGKVREHLGKISALLSNSMPPDLVLNRHCAECEFQTRCRKIAVEKDDLSLLASMSAKERQKLCSKGIFTVTQLSYTFRPRRRPMRLRSKREKYHHALKALAIREKKIHIVGSPELKIEGTPVYLDVEGLPDRDFYYLIGIRFGNGEKAVQHSLWADTIDDESKIWHEFLGVLKTVEKPVLIHYGSYEKVFLKQMCARYGPLSSDSELAQSIAKTVNCLSIISAQFYFPTYTNALKEIARFIGCSWSGAEVSGIKAIVWRHTWEQTRDSILKNRLIVYNAEDITNLQELVQVCSQLQSAATGIAGGRFTDSVWTDTMKRPQRFRWGKGEYSLEQFRLINLAAYWDYQREQVYLRTNSRIRSQAVRKVMLPCPRDRAVDLCVQPGVCEACGNVTFYRRGYRQKIVHDLHFHRRGVIRRVTRYRSFQYACARCGAKAIQESSLPHDKYGPGLLAYLVYHLVEIFVPQEAIVKMLNDLFDLRLRNSGQINPVKARAAEFYRPTYEQILERIRHGRLLHVDETKANVQGRRTYVWTFTSLDEVAYVYSESREADLPRNLLSEFKGVLVSDFYAAYDAINCPQQKCLIHLLRDINTDLLNAPFNNELRYIAEKFGSLLTNIIQTIDHFGLRARFLCKHRTEAIDFLTEMISARFMSDTALKLQKRFNKHRDALFTFLEYDGIPWNNNNAEHAVKAFARLRNVIRGSSTETGIRDYLLLLSVCQTCKYMGVDFLSFLRSGERDIHAFARRHQVRRSTRLEMLKAPSPFATSREQSTVIKTSGRH